MLLNYNGNPLIIGGDFNTCLNIIQDKKGGAFLKKILFIVTTSSKYVRISH